jgi:hypothetical protein
VSKVTDALRCPRRRLIVRMSIPAAIKMLAFVCRKEWNPTLRSLWADRNRDQLRVMLFGLIGSPSMFENSNKGAP